MLTDEEFADGFEDDDKHLAISTSTVVATRFIHLFQIGSFHSPLEEVKSAPHNEIWLD